MHNFISFFLGTSCYHVFLKSQIEDMWLDEMSCYWWWYENILNPFAIQPVLRWGSLWSLLHNWENWNHIQQRCLSNRLTQMIDTESCWWQCFGNLKGTRIRWQTPRKGFPLLLLHLLKKAEWKESTFTNKHLQNLYEKSVPGIVSLHCTSSYAPGNVESPPKEHYPDEDEETTKKKRKPANLQRDALQRVSTTGAPISATTSPVQYGPS